VELVAEACHESPAAMLQRSRQGDVAFARQLAMYLTHVMLGLNLTEAGRLFGRDRTTVAHACGLIEDRRDDPDFEALVAGLEAAVRSSGASAQHPLEAMRHAG
jgi:chromosomal replication initiation ATPase DnaA